MEPLAQKECRNALSSKTLLSETSINWVSTVGIFLFLSLAPWTSLLASDNSNSVCRASTGRVARGKVFLLAGDYSNASGETTPVTIYQDGSTARILINANENYMFPELQVGNLPTHGFDPNNGARIDVLSPTSLRLTPRGGSSIELTHPSHRAQPSPPSPSPAEVAVASPPTPAPAPRPRPRPNVSPAAFVLPGSFHSQEGQALWVQHNQTAQGTTSVTFNGAIYTFSGMRPGHQSTDPSSGATLHMLGSRAFRFRPSANEPWRVFLWQQPQAASHLPIPTQGRYISESGERFQIDTPLNGLVNVRGVAMYRVRITGPEVDLSLRRSREQYEAGAQAQLIDGSYGIQILSEHLVSVRRIVRPAPGRSFEFDPRDPGRVLVLEETNGELSYQSFQPPTQASTPSQPGGGARNSTVPGSLGSGTTTPFPIVAPTFTTNSGQQTNPNPSPTLPAGYSVSHTSPYAVIAPTVTVNSSPSVSAPVGGGPQWGRMGYIISMRSTGAISDQQRAYDAAVATNSPDRQKLYDAYMYAIRNYTETFGGQ